MLKRLAEQRPTRATSNQYAAPRNTERAIAWRQNLRSQFRGTRETTEHSATATDPGTGNGRASSTTRRRQNAAGTPQRSRGPHPNGQSASAHSPIAWREIRPPHCEMPDYSEHRASATSRGRITTALTRNPTNQRQTRLALPCTHIIRSGQLQHAPVFQCGSRWLRWTFVRNRAT